MKGALCGYCAMINDTDTNYCSNCGEKEKNK
jgi:hypothetical protein